MSIEIDEYVRINKDKRIICLGIGKVVNKVKETIYVEMGIGLPVSYDIDKIANHSKNIIDLVEVGDFVNGFRILEMKDSIYENSKIILIYKNQKEKYEQWIYIKEHDGKIHTQDDIVEILTKEQYQQNCFRLEE